MKIPAAKPEGETPTVIPAAPRAFVPMGAMEPDFGGDVFSLYALSVLCSAPATFEEEA